MSRTYRYKLEGLTPLLLHKDDIEWSDRLDEARANLRKRRQKSTPGDDRTPPWTWVGYVYGSERRGAPDALVIPADNLMKAISQGGAKIKVGKSQQTFKAGVFIGLRLQNDPPIDVGDGKKPRHVPLSAVAKFAGSDVSFPDMQAETLKLGFALWPKRAKVGTSKHVRVRPRFDQWSLEGTISVSDERISDEVLSDLFHYAGEAGLGDWRPSAPKSPGSWGQFRLAEKDGLVLVGK